MFLAQIEDLLFELLAVHFPLAIQDMTDASRVTKARHSSPCCNEVLLCLSKPPRTSERDSLQHLNSREVQFGQVSASTGFSIGMYSWARGPRLPNPNPGRYDVNRPLFLLINRVNHKDVPSLVDENNSKLKHLIFIDRITGCYFAFDQEIDGSSPNHDL